MTEQCALFAANLTVQTPVGRTLIDALSLQLGASDKVAIVGRNGVGKSTLLRVLAGKQPAKEGRVTTPMSRIFVPQRPQADGVASPGQAQVNKLARSFCAGPGLLLLDEPTHDLDQQAIDWLVGEVRRWPNALLVVSHNRQLLRCFDDFFVVSESGCRHFSGSFDALLGDIEQREEEQQQRYVSALTRLADREEHNAWVRRRRQRKKNLGRIRELGRCPSKAALNGKRSYAQESQSRRDGLRRGRIDKARAWAAAARKGLSVSLPLELVMPSLPVAGAQSTNVELMDVVAKLGDKVLFGPLSLCISRERIAVLGANGCGKSTLVELACGIRKAALGTVHCQQSRVGYVAQNATNWSDARSVVDCLVDQGSSLEDAARLLASHKFPFGLADRPLRELSPGERLRAALICLTCRQPVPELLVLDEPTDHLDFVGYSALQAFLRLWPGGLLVVSHDEEFLNTIGVDKRLTL